MLKDNKDEAFDLLRVGADLVPSRQRRCRSHPLARSSPACAATPPTRTAPRQPQIPRSRLRRPSLRPAGLRHAGERSPPSPSTTCATTFAACLAKDTLKVAVVGDVDPATLGKLLDQTFWRPAGGKADLTAGFPTSWPAKSRRSGPTFRSTYRRTVITFGSPGVIRHDPEFHARLCRQPHPGRRRIVVAALSRGAREARPRLFGLWARFLWMDHSALFIGNNRHPRRPCRR